MNLRPAGPDFLQALSLTLPADVVSVPGPEYLEEPRGRVTGRAKILLRPRDVEQVSEIMKAAAAHHVGIIPYGGGTGLVGGQIQGADGPEAALLSLERLNQVRGIYPQDNVLVVEAGVILADVQAAADAAGLLFPLSLAAEGTAQIGGNLATNAGGVQVLRYGNTRELCLGLEAVLPDGTVYHGLSRLRKDNTGYDLRHLLIGSEGTLGVITAASMRLFARPETVVTALVTVTSPTAALNLLTIMRQHFGETISAFELIHGQGLAFLQRKMPRVRVPFDPLPEWAVLIDIGAAKSSNIDAHFSEVLADQMGTGVVDALIAQNQTQAMEFWNIRENIPEANRLVGAIASHDISVPVGSIPTFIDQAIPLIASIDPRFEVNCFGHMGDGNLHFNIFPPAGGNKADHKERAAEITRVVHDLTHEMSGSISAEHGIGRMKRDDLVRYGDPVKLATMRAIKQVLDPVGIMNPGAIF